VKKVTALTAEQMMEFLYELPQQFEDSLDMKFAFAGEYRKSYQNIVISGLGGSAIGGDIIRTLAAGRAQLPVVVNRDYNLPSFVNENTFFAAISYSGNTEETLSAYQQAREKGAAIICLTSAGKLAEMAANDGYAVINVPGHLVPRAATGYLLAPLALFLEEIGLLNNVRLEIEETIQVLKWQRKMLNPEVGTPDNQARQLAEKLKGAIPIIWGSSGLTEAAALRWKAQINENAKSPAYYNLFPELNHNEIVGFEVPQELLSHLAVVMLRDPGDSPQIQKRMAITRQIIEKRVREVIEVSSLGKSFLARFYSLVYLGDYTSVYLAHEYGINPTPVEVIDYLKAELAR
jgi:glucose/mannose-6-phosphate isomerase